jgi:MFS family permease
VLIYVFSLIVLNGTAVQASRVVLALYALQLGAKPLTVGLLAATYSMFPVLLAVQVGKLGDRFGSRWLLAGGAAAGGIGMLAPYFSGGLTTIFIGGAMSGLSSVFFNLLTQNLVGILSEPHERARNFSNFSLMNSITSFLGPLYAGFTIDHAGHAYTCLFLALMAVPPVVMLSVWGGALPAGVRRSVRRGGGVADILRDAGVRRTLVTGSLQNTGDSLYQFYIPVYTHSIGLTASTIGIVLAMYPAAAFVMRLILTRLIVRFSEESLLAFAFYIGGAVLLLIPLFKLAVILALLSFVFGLGMGCCGPIVTMQMFGNAPEGRSGEALGLKMTVNNLTKVVMPVVFGSIASALGLLSVFWIDALMLGTGGYLSRPRRRGER